MSEGSSRRASGLAATRRRTVLGVTKESEKGNSCSSSYSPGRRIPPYPVVFELERELVVGDALLQGHAFPVNLAGGGLAGPEAATFEPIKKWFCCLANSSLTSTGSFCKSAPCSPIELPSSSLPHQESQFPAVGSSARGVKLCAGCGEARADW